MEAVVKSMVCQIGRRRIANMVMAGTGWKGKRSPWKREDGVELSKMKQRFLVAEGGCVADI